MAELRARTLLDTAGTSAIALAVIAVLGLGASWLLAGRMLRPLQARTGLGLAILRLIVRRAAAPSWPRACSPAAWLSL